MRRLNKNFWIDSTIGTIIIFTFMGIALWFFTYFDFLNPVEHTLTDFETTDLVFSQLRDDPVPDTNIIIINTSSLPKGAIAEQIKIINQYGPRLIALNLDLNWDEDNLGTMALMQALLEIDQLLIGGRLKVSDGNYEYFVPAVLQDLPNASYAYQDFMLDDRIHEEFHVLREFSPNPSNISQKNILPFGLKIASYYDEGLLNRFLNRKNDKEIINYRGNALGASESFGYMFMALDVDDVFEENFIPEIINDKIIIFGFLGDQYGPAYESKFFTPLNEQYVGRSNPDMYESVIHANIAAMIINEDYIERLPQWMSVLLGVALCFLTTMLFGYVYRVVPRWYDATTKLIALIQVALLLFVIILVFNWYNLRLDLTLGIIAALFASDTLEFYHSVIKNVLNKEARQEIVGSKGIINSSDKN
ncbi:MAG: CHASE2 domain-containing protein [Cyclobacteriaceae bacterium]|nr:CHASE2 domain-containing protein [Cyclobacteriaceae bacterium]MCH8515557.1 CHASE2 domain-containing protein [Cyclobacteriaceae bacterium]